MATLTCRVVRPDQLMYEGDVTSVVLISRTGEIGVMPRHASEICALGQGVMRMKLPEEDGGAGSQEDGQTGQCQALGSGPGLGGPSGVRLPGGLDGARLPGGLDGVRLPGGLDGVRLPGGLGAHGRRGVVGPTWLGLLLRLGAGHVTGHARLDVVGRGGSGRVTGWCLAHALSPRRAGAWRSHGSAPGSRG